MFRPRCVCLVTFLGLTVLNPTARADRFFDEVSKDFGSVPRGTLLTHSFMLKNSASAKLHIAGWRASCGCIAVSYSQPEVEPGETTPITVTVDTRKFSGLKSFTVFLIIDRPFAEELQLTVQINSREDITLTPLQLAFGRIKKGSAPKATVTIEHRGASNWQITGVDNENGYIKPELQELSRSPSAVVYQLTAELRADTPVGAWHADLWLKTTDASTPRLRIPLTVEIEGSLTATPVEVVMGRVKIGSQTQRKVVIRGAEPFRVTKIEGADEKIQVTAASSESKNVHVLTVTLQAGDKADEVTKRFKVITDLAAEGTVEFSLQAQIVP